ncbi:unnamed protein product, partial [Protopolystoma xenopodis]
MQANLKAAVAAGAAGLANGIGSRLPMHLAPPPPSLPAGLFSSGQAYAQENSSILAFGVLHQKQQQQLQIQQQRHQRSQGQQQILLQQQQHHLHHPSALTSSNSGPAPILDSTPLTTDISSVSSSIVAVRAPVDQQKKTLASNEVRAFLPISTSVGLSCMSGWHEVEYSNTFALPTPVVSSPIIVTTAVSTVSTAACSVRMTSTPIPTTPMALQNGPPTMQSLLHRCQSGMATSVHQIIPPQVSQNPPSVPSTAQPSTPQLLVQPTSILSTAPTPSPVILTNSDDAIRLSRVNSTVACSVPLAFVSQESTLSRDTSPFLSKVTDSTVKPLNIPKDLSEELANNFSLSSLATIPTSIGPTITQALRSTSLRSEPSISQSTSLLPLTSSNSSETTYVAISTSHPGELEATLKLASDRRTSQPQVIQPTVSPPTCRLVSEGLHLIDLVKVTEPTGIVSIDNTSSVSCQNFTTPGYLLTSVPKTISGTTQQVTALTAIIAAPSPDVFSELSKDLHSSSELQPILTQAKASSTIPSYPSLTSAAVVLTSPISEHSTFNRSELCFVDAPSRLIDSNPPTELPLSCHLRLSPPLAEAAKAAAADSQAVASATKALAKSAAVLPSDLAACQPIIAGINTNNSHPSPPSAPGPTPTTIGFHLTHQSLSEDSADRPLTTCLALELANPLLSSVTTTAPSLTTAILPLRPAKSEDKSPPTHFFKLGPPASTESPLHSPGSCCQQASPSNLHVSSCIEDS